MPTHIRKIMEDDLHIEELVVSMLNSVFVDDQVGTYSRISALCVKESMVRHQIEGAVIASAPHSPPKTTFAQVLSSPRPQSHDTPPASEVDKIPKEATFFKTSLCRYWTNGASCPKGDACTYAHGYQQLRTYKTAVCRDWLVGQCERGTSCAYAHGTHELRHVENLCDTITKACERSTSSMGIESAITQINKLRVGTKLKLREAIKSVLIAQRVPISVVVLKKEIETHFRPNSGAGNLVLNEQSLLIFCLMYPTVFLTNLRFKTVGLVSTSASTNKHCVDHSEKLARLLHFLGLGKFEPNFREQGLDIETLLMLERPEDLDAITFLPPGAKTCLSVVLQLSSKRSRSRRS